MQRLHRDWKQGADIAVLARMLERLVAAPRLGDEVGRRGENEQAAGMRCVYDVLHRTLALLDLHGERDVALRHGFRKLQRQRMIEAVGLSGMDDDRRRRFGSSPRCRGQQKNGPE